MMRAWEAGGSSALNVLLQPPGCLGTATVPNRALLAALYASSEKPDTIFEIGDLTKVKVYVEEVVLLSSIDFNHRQSPCVFAFHPTA